MALNMDELSLMAFASEEVTSRKSACANRLLMAFSEVFCVSVCITPPKKIPTL